MDEIRPIYPVVIKVRELLKSAHPSGHKGKGVAEIPPTPVVMNVREWLKSAHPSGHEGTGMAEIRPPQWS